MQEDPEMRVNMDYYAQFDGVPGAKALAQLMDMHINSDVDRIELDPEDPIVKGAAAATMHDLNVYVNMMEPDRSKGMSKMAYHSKGLEFINKCRKARGLSELKPN